MKKKIIILLPFLLILLLALPVLAIGTHQAEITVTDTSSSNREGVPVLIPFNTDLAVSLGFLDSDGLDSRFFEGTTERSYMVADDKIGVFIPSLLADQERMYRFETGYSPPNTSFGVITGYEGYVTIPDDATLELGSDFEVEFDGWVDMSVSVIPNVVDTNTSTENTEVTSHTVNLPADVEAGDLLLMVFGGIDSGSGSPTITWPNGWTNLDTYYYAGSLAAGIAYRVADGSEESTAEVTTSCSILSAHQTYRITNYNGVPVTTTEASGSSDSPNSGSLTTGFGSACETLWFTFFAATRTTMPPSMKSFPTNYGDGLHTIGGAGSYYAMVGSATRLLAAASEDPGSFTVSGTVNWGAWTVGIKGDIPLVKKEDSFYIFTGSGNLYAKIVAFDITQVASSGNVHLYTGSYIRAGEKFTSMPMGYIDSVSVDLVKVGSPTGTAYVRLRKVSDDSVIGTFGSIDVSTISNTFGAWYDFTTPVFNPTAQATRVTVEYDGGNGANYVGVYYEDSDKLAGAHYCYFISEPWNDSLTGYDLTFELDYRECSVSATSITVGDYNVRVAGDGTNMKLYIDDVEKDSETVRVCLDNDNDWVISSPYFDYYEHTVSDTLIVDYEPITMISGTTLPDKEGTAQNGVITWGANQYLTLEVGGLQSITEYQSESVEEGEPPMVAPDLPDLPLFPEEEAVTTLPWYDLVSPAAMGLEWSTNTLYGVLYMFAAIGIGVGVMIATGSVLLAAIATGAGLTVAASTGVLGWWVLIVYGIFATTYLVATRSM